jgi:hypothetical protein
MHFNSPRYLKLWQVIGHVDEDVASIYLICIRFFEFKSAINYSLNKCFVSVVLAK